MNLQGERKFLLRAGHFLWNALVSGRTSGNCGCLKKKCATAYESGAEATAVQTLRAFENPKHDGQKFTPRI